jgi:hypothetical protein
MLNLFGTMDEELSATAQIHIFAHKTELTGADRSLRAKSDQFTVKEDRLFQPTWLAKYSL